MNGRSLWLSAGTILLAGGCAYFQPLPEEGEGPVRRPAATARTTPAPAASEPAETLDPRFVRPSFTVLEYHEAASGADIVRAISDRVRRNIRLPRGSKFPPHAEVTIETMLSPRGYVMSPRVARSSGYKALDQAVMDALRRAQPLPVTPAMREKDASELLRLRFRPAQK
ncbi:TonB family protein [Uliginosibacterium paludis]|uniref:TonB family protein n=1 Tax=Uliginosibacterium paludis TaxID=1615952 RepID=A0ABV2CR76_9RHOO